MDSRQTSIIVRGDDRCHKGEAMLAHAIPLAEESYEKVLKVIEKK